MLRDSNDAKKAIQIYKELAEAREKQSEVSNETEFFMVVSKGWARCPVPLNIGKPLMRYHYDEYIQSLEKELMDLGFTPDDETAMGDEK
ncbi:MAG: hypothetical protein WBE18_07535 [Gammaproteobacteria bacterium]